MDLRVEITFFQLYKWQATLCSESFREMSCGVTRLQFSSTLGHRLAKRHPAGTFTGEGISPRIVVDVLPLSTLGSGSGLEPTKISVYGCFGLK